MEDDNNPENKEDTEEVYDDSILAGLVYIFAFPLGFIIFFLNNDEYLYERIHAINALVIVAICMGLLFPFQFITNLLSLVMNYTSLDNLSQIIHFQTGLAFITTLLQIAVLLVIITLAIRAYKGHMIKIPVVTVLVEKIVGMRRIPGFLVLLGIALGIILILTAVIGGMIFVLL